MSGPGWTSPRTPAPAAGGGGGGGGGGDSERGPARSTSGYGSDRGPARSTSGYASDRGVERGDALELAEVLGDIPEWRDDETARVVFTRFPAKAQRPQAYESRLAVWRRILLTAADRGALGRSCFVMDAARLSSALRRRQLQPLCMDTVVVRNGLGGGPARPGLWLGPCSRASARVVFAPRHTDGAGGGGHAQAGAPVSRRGRGRASTRRRRVPVEHGVVGARLCLELARGAALAQRRRRRRRKRTPRAHGRRPRGPRHVCGRAAGGGPRAARAGPRCDGGQPRRPAHVGRRRPRPLSAGEGTNRKLGAVRPTLAPC